MTLDISSPDGDLGQKFIDIHRERHDAVLKILGAGWKRVSACPEVHPEAGEVEITERLRDGMRDALDEKIADWCKKMTVLPGTESRSSLDVPVPDGRTDIPVFFQEIRKKYKAHDPHAIIECKRIAGNDTTLCRRYVREGIERFRCGQYARNHLVGFMAGYLLSGDASTATARINHYLPADEQLGLSAVFNAPWVRSSRHPRSTSGTPIALHHAFLAFQAAQP